MASAITPQSAAPARSASDPAHAVSRRRGKPDDGLAANARVSSWRVERELGRGGMSSVHAVVHTKFGKRAAIKIAHRSVLKTGMSAETFLREARIVHTVQHPAVIDVFATGSHDSRPYLVMERLAGMPLGRRVDEGPPLPRREVIDILLELCHVLRAAHEAGIVHRDLKLDNVFLCDTPFADGRRVKLLDWGVAHIDGEDDPFHGLIAGTLTYVAPEQIRGDAMTGAADIYSLGVLAYSLLCRRAPFVGPDLALLQMHLRVEPPPASLAWPDCPPELEHLLAWMMAKRPEDRPSLDDIEDVLRRMAGVVEHPIQFAEGSNPNIVLPTQPPKPESWLMRWLKPGATVKPLEEMKADALGRPIVPLPSFRLGWIAVAVSAATLAISWLA